MIYRSGRFLIVGLGLMGGSYAMGLSRRGYTVTALDTDPAAIQWALEHGLISDGASDRQDAAELVSRADYIILALYPKAITAWLETYHQYFTPGALLTDLAGVKGCFVEQAQALLGARHEFIPSHPMAGRETAGIQNANDAMFEGANFIITPTEANTQTGIAFAKELAGILGFGHTTILSVEEHDQMIGYVSQLTHAIAVSLMNANSDPRLPQVTGDSFRDLTRIANINDELWSELFLANGPTLVQEIDFFAEALMDLRRKLAEGDKTGLQRLFRQSTQRRKEFDKDSTANSKNDNP